MIPGQHGVISGIHAEATLKMHLMELGFVAGSPVTFVMTTPFGDPNVYSLRGTCIALRKSEARCIRVTGVTGVTAAAAGAIARVAT